MNNRNTIVYASTVIRGADISNSGHFYKIDWNTQQILAQVPVPAPTGKEVGPRGSKRGGRGFTFWKEQLVATNYDSLIFYDSDLNEVNRISLPKFCGIHEIDSDEKGIWISNTGTESILLIDVEKEEIVEEHFVPGIDAFTKSEPFVEPRKQLILDDYRNLIYSRSEMSTHINCVECFKGNVYGLLSNLGAVVQLKGNYKTILQDTKLVDPHNLLFTEDYLLINDTGKQTIRIYDHKNGELIRSIDLNKLGLKIKKPGTILKGVIKISTPGWLRGIAQISNSTIIVGISPSTIVEIDLETGHLRKKFVLSKDVNNSIHGLLALV